MRQTASDAATKTVAVNDQIQGSDWALLLVPLAIIAATASLGFLSHDLVRFVVLFVAMSAINLRLIAMRRASPPLKKAIAFAIAASLAAFQAVPMSWLFS